MDSISLTQKIQERFKTSLQAFETHYDLPVMTVSVSDLHAVLSTLKNDPEFNFFFLTDLTGYQSADEQHLCVVYHLHNLQSNNRIRVKSFMPIQQPECPTATTLWPAANWMERETFDFYGIRFTGHPQLKRILNVDEMDIFPLRKEFPLEDQTRDDKKDYLFGR